MLDLALIGTLEMALKQANVSDNSVCHISTQQGKVRAQPSTLAASRLCTCC